MAEPQDIQAAMDAAIKRRMDEAILRQSQQGAGIGQPVPLSPPPMQPPPGLLGGMGEAITGRATTEFPEMPEVSSLNARDFGISVADEGKLAGRLMAAADDEQRKAAILRYAPNARFTTDAGGNTIVHAPASGAVAYLNKPGITAQTGLNLAGQGAAFMAGAAPFAGVRSLLGRSALMGGSSAGVSAGLDVAAAPEVGVDPGRTVAAGLGGAVGEFIAPALSAVYRQIVRRPALYQGGVLTEAGRRAAARAGLTDDQISDDIARRVDDMLREAATVPEEAGLAVRAASLDVPVPVSRGRVLRDPAQQMAESQALKGVYGDAAQKRMQELIDAQQSALVGNVGALQARLSGGNRFLDTLEGRMQYPARGSVRGTEGLETAGGRVMDELERLRLQDKALVEANYRAAREAGEAVVEPERASNLIASISEIPRPAARFSTPAKEAIAKADELESLLNDPGVSVSDLFDWRRSASEARQSVVSSNPLDYGKLSQMISQFDDNIKDLAAEGLMSGDAKVAQLWSDAVKSRASYGARWQSGDLVDRILKREYVQGEYRLRETPQSVSNLIFGTSKAKLMSADKLARELGVLKSRLGAQSPEWNMIREEAFMRLAEAAKGVDDQGVRLFSGTKFNDRWQEMRKQNRALVNQLFSKEEQRAINNFAQTANEITSVKIGGENFSNTGAALGNAARTIAGLFRGGDKITTFLAPMMIVGDVVQGVAGRQAAKAQFRQFPRRQTPRGVGAAIGALTGRTEPELLQ